MEHSLPHGMEAAMQQNCITKTLALKTPSGALEQPHRCHPHTQVALQDELL